ncbi:hypothetical protein [Spongiactinospora rosea]|uniref:hypothetical protein n=1 Tax=Spongiactinospora rosea TaxID=2248750 RepID=UPI0011C04223|nr:hypothetical protein [Spongiactinospora rosea]
MSFDLWLIAYYPNGARRGLLPHPGRGGVPVQRRAQPAVRLQLERAGADLIATSAELQLQWTTDGHAWFDYAEGRFLLIRREGDQLADTGRLVPRVGPRR